MVSLTFVQKWDANLHPDGAVIAFERLIVLVVIVVLAEACVLSNEIHRRIKLLVLTTRLKQLRRRQLLCALEDRTEGKGTRRQIFLL